MKKLLFIHPLLFGLYPALFLYSQNINHFRVESLSAPLFISIIFSVSVFLLCRLVLRKPETSAVISLLLILIFFSYSRIKDVLKHSQISLGSFRLGPDQTLFIVLIFTLVTLILLIFYYQQYLKRINRGLSILSSILIIITASSIIFSEIKMGRVTLSNLVSEINPLQSFSFTQEINTPDIYYFVPDRYAGNKTLHSYGFDNSAFLKFLKNKGFYIAEDATSNYPKTFLSLGSTLNMEYLDFLTQKTKGGGTSDESIVTPLVQNNKVIKFLKSKGYSYIHVGSGWDPSRSNPNATRNFVMTNGRYPFADEFTSGFLQTTIAAPILKKLYPDILAVSLKPKNNDHRSRVLYEFEVFDQIIKIPGPKFVFAHILLPHDPYVLDKNCEPLTEKQIAARPEIENYLNQLQCTNIKMVETINKILANSPTPPIIIIQSDEGPLPIQNPIPPKFAWSKANDDSIKEKFPILNAYLLPNIKKSNLYPSITPVNSFRLIFNLYFNTNLPLLPDRNIIFTDNQNYYKFTDITDRLKSLLPTQQIN